MDGERWLKWRKAVIQSFQEEDVFVKYYAPGGNKVRKSYFSVKVKVKATVIL